MNAIKRAAAHVLLDRVCRHRRLTTEEAEMLRDYVLWLENDRHEWQLAVMERDR